MMPVLSYIDNIISSLTSFNSFLISLVSFLHSFPLFFSSSSVSLFVSLPSSFFPPPCHTMDLLHQYTVLSKEILIKSMYHFTCC